MSIKRHPAEKHLPELARVLKGGVARDAAELARVSKDFAGNPLGAALAVARPKTTEEVVALVAWARKRKVPLTPVGALTSFWASTKAEGRVLADLSRMRRLIALDETEQTAAVEAGMTVAELDRALKARGWWLPCAPDGFGDATVASMLSNDTQAGLGMFEGPVSNHVVSATIVTGAGDVLRTGASSVMSGFPAFSRSGLPDLTGPFFAAEGGLGIVTEAVLRVRPRPLSATLALTKPAGPESERALLALVHRLRAGSLCHSWMHMSWVTGKPDDIVIQVTSHAGDEDLETKLRRVREPLDMMGLKAERVAEPPEPWITERPMHGWKGIAVVCPYGRVLGLRDLWRSKLLPRLAGVAYREGFLRHYYGPGAVASLISWSHKSGEDHERLNRDLACQIRASLLYFGIPYRVGTVWQPLLAGRVDATYRKYLDAIKDVFDPDGIMNPGVGVLRMRKVLKK